MLLVATCFSPLHNAGSPAIGVIETITQNQKKQAVLKLKDSGLSWFSEGREGSLEMARNGHSEDGIR